MINQPPHEHLIGSPEENFYALGLKDAEGFKELYNNLKLLCLRSKIFSQAVKISIDLLNLKNKKNLTIKEDHQKYLEAYGEGLKVPMEELLFSYFLPEYLAAFNKWNPNILNLIPGCSSLFTRGTNNSVIHSRVLDYPFGGLFEKNERSLLYDFNGRYKIFSFSTRGMVFPSLSAINEKGLSLALHYKHGNYFDQKGYPIFLSIFDILSYCSTIQDVKKYLQNYPSMAHWGLYLSDAKGDVGSFDIIGKNIHQEKLNIKEHEFLYYNNRPIVIENENNELQPYGNKNQCQMRREVFVKKWNHKEELENKALESLKVLTSPLNQKKIDSKNFKLDSINIASIQGLTFNFEKKEAYFIGGEAPKMYCGSVYHYKNLFNEISIEEIKLEKKHSASKEITTRFSKAQSALDFGDIEKAYHEIQMGILLAKGQPEEIIYQFFFNVLEYMYEPSKKDLGFIYKNFRELNGKLPLYLQDHLYLFIMRCEKILKIEEIDEAPPIQHIELKKLYEKELKLPAKSLSLLRRFIYPRMEILDIIYPL